MDKFKIFDPGFNHPDSVFYKQYRRQLMATLLVNIISFSHGNALGWGAPIIFDLQSDSSPLSFNISVKEASWIGGFIAIGAFVGNLIFGILLYTIGRKYCIYLLAVPNICFWVMVFFARTVYYLYAARIFAGITGGGIFLIIPIFVSEIADRRIRGTLGSFFSFSINVGILSGFILASNFPYHLIPCIVVVLPIVYLLLWIQFPETPHHLLRKGLTDQAENSFKFYTNYNCSSEEDLEKYTSEFAELKMSIQVMKAKAITIHDFCTKRSLKAICSGIVLVFVNQTSGSFCILNYSPLIFAETGSRTHPNTNTIFIGLVQIVGSACATILVDRYGRKFLMLVSTSSMCLGLIVFGTYAYALQHLDLSKVTWMPVVILSFVIFSSNIGIVPVTFIFVVEILPPKIRSIGLTICTLLFSIFSFTILKLFPILMVAIGLYGVIWICATVAGFGFFFVLICLRETKGKSVDNDSTYD